MNLKQKLNEKQLKITENFTPSKKLFCVCMYKMVDISAETYENNGVEVIVDKGDTKWLNEKHL